MAPLRFKPLIWIEILRRRVEQAGAYLMVLQKGDPDGGSVTLIVENGSGTSVLYTAQTQMDGSRSWHAEADLSVDDLGKRIKSLKRMDEDLWVIEITDRQGRHFLNEPVITS